MGKRVQALPLAKQKVTNTRGNKESTATKLGQARPCSRARPARKVCGAFSDL